MYCNSVVSSVGEFVHMATLNSISVISSCVCLMWQESQVFTSCRFYHFVKTHWHRCYCAVKSGISIRENLRRTSYQQILAKLRDETLKSRLLPLQPPSHPCPHAIVKSVIAILNSYCKYISIGKNSSHLNSVSYSL